MISHELQTDLQYPPPPPPPLFVSSSIMVLIVWYLDLQLPVLSVPMTNKVVSSNPAHQCEVYSIQNYVVKFVTDLLQVSGFFLVLRFPPPINLYHNITEILLKVALNTLTLDYTCILRQYSASCITVNCIQYI